MEKNSKIYVAGHKGLVGSAIIRNLKKKNYINILSRTHTELDLTIQSDVNEFFKKEKPEYVILAAAKVGGIVANKIYPANFIMENLLIECNIIKAAFKNDVKKLMFLGSSCIYPKMCPQPIKEDYLLSGYLEETNEAYALAKIVGLKMCQYYNKQFNTNYISVMPTNLYGYNDNFDLETSHVIPALIRKIHEANLEHMDIVEIWGTGSPLREFLHSDDLADACVFLLETYNGNDFFNIGTGKEISIRDLACMIKEIVGFKGNLKFNIDKPNGTPRKLLDISRLEKIGWKYRIELEDGLRKTYQWFKEENAILNRK